MSQHVPAPKINHVHHILPRAWGGSDAPDNRVPLCPTGHAVVHHHLDRWRRYGSRLGRSGRDNRYLYDLAVEGWNKHQSTKASAD